MRYEDMLRGKVALVTGAGSGMGRAHCEVMAARGAHVIVQELIAERADAVAAAVCAAGGSAETLPGDVRDTGFMARSIADAVERLGAVDILVNNAGISGNRKPLEAIDEAAYDEMMDLHVRASFFCIKAIVPGMKAKRWGRIINMASMLAMKGSPNAVHYTAAKGALLGLTKSLARELAPWNITVNAVAPGLVKTEMTIGSLPNEAAFEAYANTVPLGRLAEPCEVSYSVAFLASDEAAMITGQTISPAGGDAIVGI
ncbi:SDR family NAD(P)-dependent oxidoreductase [Sphingobium sp.]|uniref:SDR family NAD(P)-dependent oxidoreductase n=1 Tax=Sphingobium sp. TaxID=1912891 RepID=UPI0028BE2193|nr:SDR family NAD(P)-dependent oxidoreductase [Sphingobium sp.]